MGFTRMYIGKNQSEPDFSLRFPEEMEFWDEKILRMIYDALPIIKEWQAKAAEQDVEINIVSVNTLQMDVQKEHSSWTELANDLAEDNMKSYTQQFIEKDLEKMGQIKDELKELDFNSSNPLCIEVKDFQTCASYSLTLHPLTREQHNRYFEYDHEEDREKLFEAIEMIKKIELSLKEINVETISVPMNKDDQIYSMKEIEERGGPNKSLITSVTITNIHAIDSVDDIHFEY